MAVKYDFSGVWRSKYTVPSGPTNRIIVTEHNVIMYHHGDHLIVESLPNQEGSYLMARFTLDDRIATGSYHSHNSPKSAAKRAAYYGAAQLILDPDGNALRGKGVGFGKDMTVKMSDWELVRVKHHTKQKGSASGQRTTKSRT